MSDYFSDLSQRLDEVVRDAESFLELDVSELPPADRKQRLWEQVQRARVLSRRGQIRAVARAYAMWLIYRDSAHPDRIDLESQAKRLGRGKLGRRTNIAQVFSELMVGYGDFGELARARRLHNRNAHAMNYLLEMEVLPSAVEALAKEKGEGLDTWSRAHKESETTVSLPDRGVKVTVWHGRDKLAQEQVAPDVGKLLAGMLSHLKFEIIKPKLPKKGPTPTWLKDYQYGSHAQNCTCTRCTGLHPLN